MSKKRNFLLVASTATIAITALSISFKSILSKSSPQRQRTDPSATLSTLEAQTTNNTPPPLDIESAEEIKSIDESIEEEFTNKEGVLSFKNSAQYQHFLNNLSSRNLSLISHSDQLLSARVRFTSFEQLEGIEGAEITPNFPVTLPTPPEVSTQAGAQAFGGTALKAIGITSDNSHWGNGVTVAVIDSGVNNHIALQDGVSHMSLVELDGSEQLSHGTAVASIISGNHSSTPGVAPAAEILSIRVTDNSGRSDSYTLAEAIILASDNGAQIINISMGAESGSPVLARAVDYAIAQGVAVVASSGNNGADSLSYPAAYSGVISVGAIEANGEHLDFSNQADNLSLTAPGFEVSAAWGERHLTGFTGTSASAPFVSGSLAAILSERPELSIQQATDLLLTHTNEGGIPGPDPEFGAGRLDVGRALESGSSGIYDIAVTSQLHQTDPSGNESLLIVIENQGTETVFNSPVTVTTPQGQTTISINSLTPGSLFTKNIPITTTNQEENVVVHTSVATSTHLDRDPDNNTLSTQIRSTSNQTP